MIRVFGIRYRFHPLFVLLLVMSVFAGYFAELLTLFAIVLIHELGHVAAASAFGWRIRLVQLLPFGGVAEVEKPGDPPAREELLVALAGPLQNVWMLAVAWAMQHSGWGDPVWWSYFMQANLMIALFNLLPILPLDGGKVMLTVLSYAMSYHRALVAGSWISLVMSVFLVAGALFPVDGHGLQLNLLLVGVFLLVSNWYGHRHIPFRFLRFLMGRELRVASLIRQGTVASPIVTSRTGRIHQVMRLFMRERYHLVYVLEDSGTIGKVVPEGRLIDTYLIGKKPDGYVSDL